MIFRFLKRLVQTPWMLEGLGNLRDASQRPRRRSRGAWLSWLFALFAVLSLTAAIGSRYYNEPQLTIRTPAPQTLYAPQNAQVEDKIATSEARKAARQSALNAFTISEPATEQINADFTNLLTQAQSLRRLAGALPYVSTGLLSTEVQRTLRSIDRSQLETLLSALALDSNPRSETFSPPALKQGWAELQTLAGRPLSARQEIAQRSRQANDQYQFARRSASDELAALQVEPILDISDSGWTALKTRSRDILQKMLIQGIAPGLLPDVTQRAVAVQVKDWDVLDQQAALQLLPAVLRSNVVLNPAESFRQQERAAQQIQPIEVQIRRGDLIVRQGQPITSASFALLDHFGLSRREPNFSGLLLVMMAISGAVGIYAKLTRSHRSWRYLDDALVLLLALSAPLMIGVTEVVYTTLPAVGVLLGSFYGARLGAAAVLLLGLLIPLGLQVSGMTFGVIVLGSLVGSVMAGFARSREELARVSIILGATQTVAYIVLLGLRDPFGLDSAWGIALRQGLIGVGWCIIAIGVSPYLEKLFDLITPVRLAELANPNRPLLKKLAETAPGTFQHTHFVTTLAEAGARALDCNVELVRTGTLYHDIGKMHDPQAFIENQFGAPNKHAEINDPWVSAELIRKHVTEGLVMARKAGLPGAVQAFIPEHQGTMLISYFYQQACQMEQGKPAPVPIHEEDFRYAGPAPQSRETGIVMLADSCEAALRSMKQEDPAVALRTINQIFKARWQGDQLKDSGLNREDLKTLAQVFVCVWQQVNHQRIPYPQPLAPLPHASRWPRP